LIAVDQVLRVHQAWGTWWWPLNAFQTEIKYRTFIEE
jgi:hypothetical protein